MKKIPAHIAKINPELGAVIKIPRWKNRAQIKELEKDLLTTPGYIGLVGRTLFFEFDTTTGRDEFLQEAGQMIERRGDTPERINQKI